MGIREIRDGLYDLQFQWTETRGAGGDWTLVIADYDDERRVFGSFVLPAALDTATREQVVNDVLRTCLQVRNAVADPVERALKALR